MANIIKSPDPLVIQEDDVEVSTSANTLNFEGIVTVTDEGECKTTIVIDPSVNALGKDHGYEFFNNGANVSNKWMDYVGANVPCDDTPGVITGNSKMRSISFTNANDSVNIDIEIYKNGTAPGDKVFTWAIRDCRTAWKTNGSIDLVTFNIGDEIRCYAKNVGNPKPSKAVVKVILISTDDVLADDCREFLI